MSILCSMCGRLSQDPEFCDHCNADLGTSGKSLPPEQCPLAAGDSPLTLQERHVLLFPEASILVAGPHERWRVHWISEYDWRERGDVITERHKLDLAPLPQGRFVDEEKGRWLAYPSFRDADLVAAPDEPEDWLKRLARLSAAVHSLAHALEALHKQGLLWLNFDPNALEDAGQLIPPFGTPASPGLRALQITNLDIDVFPFGAMPERVRVHPHFAAPEIVQFRVEDIDARSDVYHLAMFAYYWIAGQLPDGLPGSGVENHDFAMPFLRVFAPGLPEGIIPVVKKGLSLQPGDRFASSFAFARALDESIARAQRRRVFDGTLRFELGAQTRTGRAKTEVGRNNEDAVLIKQDDQAALALVADGVSTCDIGSGGLASMMATIVIENALAEGCNHDTFPAIITAAAQRGSQGLLEWAIAHGSRADLEAGKDLMGTTLTVGWLQDRELSVANLGDSRAYLVTNDLVEQLTVDGDLASDLLARGATPEEVRELGVMARALRECIGGCITTESGEVTILIDSCTPKITRWPLLPGDIVVLCTDGLVEEGYFLEPENVAEIVREHRDRSAPELALMLVDAADALQRVPTILEPDGFGDNVSCVVVKVV
jgi:serine/threonine protein phosphatase PrpC